MGPDFDFKLDPYTYGLVSSRAVQGYRRRFRTLVVESPNEAFSILVNLLKEVYAGDIRLSLAQESGLKVVSGMDGRSQVAAIAEQTLAAFRGDPVIVRVRVGFRIFGRWYVPVSIIRFNCDA